MGKRARLFRRIVLALSVLGLLGVGAWLLNNLTFPSRAQVVQGTPYVARVQPGVPAEDVRLVLEGLIRIPVKQL